MTEIPCSELASNDLDLVQWNRDGGFRYVIPDSQAQILNFSDKLGLTEQAASELYPKVIEWINSNNPSPVRLDYRTGAADSPAEAMRLQKLSGSRVLLGLGVPSVGTVNGIPKVLYERELTPEEYRKLDKLGHRLGSNNQRINLSLVETDDVGGKRQTVRVEDGYDEPLQNTKFLLGLADGFRKKINRFLTDIDQWD